MADKELWTKGMTDLLSARENGTIKDVIEVLKKTNRPRLPDNVSEQEVKYELLKTKTEEDLEDSEKKTITDIEALHSVTFKELTNVGHYINDKTLFSTKHGVKGAQFENVLVVFGRGWNHYNWTQMLEWFKNGVPKGKEETYERNRNLFYVACSRPKKRLALLFTQKLSVEAKDALQLIFHVPINEL